MLAEHRADAAIALADIPLLRTLPLTLALTTVAACHTNAVDILLCWKFAVRLFYAALSALLEPHPFNPSVPHMQTLVRDGIDAFQVFQAVVCAVMVAMMNLEAIRDWAMGFFPQDPMLTDQTTIFLNDEDVAGRSDELEARGLSVF